ncbi:VaFE repeat-containing surface-anchored protein [Candidatus Saccharibacteria bacterium]|nr:VaFE repeat-containing surface-anchored protein [Candidatus Saccharibacteria bacterium]
MLKIQRRKTFARTAFLSVFVALFFGLTAYVVIDKQEKSIAITPGGTAVAISKKNNNYYRYGAEDNYTSWYRATPNTTPKVTYDAYCAEPSDHDPVDKDNKAYPISGGKNDVIKLLIYLREYASATDELRTAIYGPIQVKSYWGKNQTNRIYAYTHAVIGAVYDNDYKGLNSTAKERIQGTVAMLSGAINENHSDWQAAMNFTLFYAKPRSDGYQDVVWVEPPEGIAPYEPLVEETGQITVQKCDIDLTGTCVSQGNADFNGITFSVYNDESALVDYGVLENGNTTIVFDDLELDRIYNIVEGVGSNVSYNLDSNSSRTVQLNGASKEVTVVFNNNVKRGSVTVNKIDKETGTCESSIERDFAGTTIQVINTSARGVVYNGNLIASGQVVDTKVFSSNDCSVSFANLPYGTYQVKETVAATGYVLDSTPYDVSIPSGGTYGVSITMANQPIRGDLKFIKKDLTNARPMGNATFVISALNKNNQVKETHIVVTDQNGEVDTSSSFALHSFNMNGYDSLYDDITQTIKFSGYGVWFGKNANNQQIQVNDGVGALPYGTYIINELRCDYNLFCLNLINQNRTITIDQHNQVIDLGEWGNDCTKFSVDTVATDYLDGDKFIRPGNETAVKDTITYCARKGVEFTIVGTIMDKETGEPLVINGEKVEKSITFTPEEDCGVIEMVFPFDTTELVGKSVVAFEKLYYKDIVEASHEDIDAPEQTVDIIDFETFVKPMEDGEKVFPSDSNIEVKDVVKYCLRPGLEYTIKGIVMNKETGDEVVIDGVPVTSEVTFTPGVNCGELEMSFKFNTTGLNGAKLVIFTELYFENNVILENKNIDDLDESFEIDDPLSIPETGSITKDVSNGEANSYVEIAVIVIAGLASIGLYAINRRRSRVTLG